MQTMEAVKTVLQGMGFRYDDYPEVETEYHNFDALNTPKWHPSRDMHDSFYTKAGGVLRTHTTAFQVRAMRAAEEPADPRDDVRPLLPPRRDRRDPLPDLQPARRDRDRPGDQFRRSQMDPRSLDPRLAGPGSQASVSTQLFPVHHAERRGRRVLPRSMDGASRLGHDPPGSSSQRRARSRRYQGFAFGMGIDRLTMARYGIDDIRLLYANEESFLTQF